MSNAARATVMTTAGGRITCPRCQAQSKRTRTQCRAPAMKGKRVCRFHGGKSTGPRTQAGLERCAAARTVDGQDTRAMRVEHRRASIRLKQLNLVARQLGLFGPRRNYT